MKNIWYVRGDPNAAGEWPNLFTTKGMAEHYARVMFPDESPNNQYARVFYREVFEEGDVL